MKDLIDLQDLIEMMAYKQKECLEDADKSYGSASVVAFNNMFYAIQEAYDILEQGYRGTYLKRKFDNYE